MTELARYPLLFLSLGMAACAGSGTGSGNALDDGLRSSEAPVVAHRSRPLPPVRLEGWSLVEQNTATLDNGVRTRFRRPNGGLDFDTFVYPVPIPEGMCPLECLESFVTGESDQFRDAGPEQVVQAGYFSALILTDDRRYPAPAEGFTEIRHLTFDATETDGREGRSDFLLVAGRGYRVKLRMTDYEGLSDPGIARSVLEEFVRKIVWPYDCRIGPAGPESVSVETTLAVEPRPLAIAIDSLLQSDGRELKSRSRMWIGTPVFEWPQTPDSEPWPADVSPGYQLLVMIQPRGDSTALAVRAPGVCDIGPEGASVLPALQTAITGLISAKIGGAIGGSNQGLFTLAEAGEPQR